MSIETEIRRLTDAKAEIVTAIKKYGVTVPDDATLDNLADRCLAIAAILTVVVDTELSETSENAVQNKVIYNAIKDSNNGKMATSVYDPRNKATDIFTYADNIKDDIQFSINDVTDQLANVYEATLLLDGWTAAGSDDSAQGYAYTQTVDITPSDENPDAPDITENSTFLTGVYRTPVKVKATDDVLDAILPIINSGITTSGEGTITVLVKEKPTADILCKWTMKA